MREGTCEFCELDFFGNHESHCRIARGIASGLIQAGYVQIDGWPEEIKESLTWFRCLKCDGLCGCFPSFPICPNCGAEVPDYLFVESEPWPDFPETNSLLEELDYRELYKDAEIGRSFWFALAKELAAVLHTCQSGLDKRAVLWQTMPMKLSERS